MLVCYVLFQFWILLIFGALDLVPSECTHSFRDELQDDNLIAAQKLLDSLEEEQYVHGILDFIISIFKDISKEMKILPPQNRMKMARKICENISRKFIFLYQYSSEERLQLCRKLYCLKYSENTNYLLSKYNPFLMIANKLILAAYKFFVLSSDFLQKLEDNRMVLLPVQIYGFRMLEVFFKKNHIEIRCYPKEYIDDSFLYPDFVNFKNHNEFSKFLVIHKNSLKKMDQSEINVQKIDKKQISDSLEVIKKACSVLQNLTFTQFKAHQLRNAFVTLIEKVCFFVVKMCNNETGLYYFCFTGESFVFAKDQDKTEKILLIREPSLSHQFNLLIEVAQEFSKKEITDEITK